MTTPQAPAGWYPDPTGGPGHLYWDGAHWHANLVPTGTPAAPSTPPAARLSSSVAQERRLSGFERNQILMQELAYQLNSGGVVGSVDPTSGIVSVRRAGPYVVKRGETWARVAYTTPCTHPAYILLRCVFALLSCGCYLPFWFFITLRKPKVYTVDVDEYGHKTSTRVNISVAQRIQCVIVGTVLVWWLTKAVDFMNGVGPLAQWWNG